MISTDLPEDVRFDRPLYTVAEAARMLRVPPSTFSTWARGYQRSHPGRPSTISEPILTLVRDRRRGWPEVPFVGLVEGMVAAAFREAGVSMQHIRKALPVLAREMGVDHALASRGLRTDGAQIFYDYAVDDPDVEADLAVVLTQQRVFAKVIDEYLSRIEFDDTDMWASRLVLPGTERRVVEVDPRRGFGKPLFIVSGARVEDVLDRFLAGEPLGVVSEDFGVPMVDLEDVLRATIPQAA